ncbi:MAG: hypothetical protein ACO305_06600 [Rubrivivax sp.]
MPAPPSEPPPLIVPFASTLSQAVRQTLPTLRLPHLAMLAALADEQALPAEGADPQAPELSLNLPHERAFAQAMGWSVADGGVPLAAGWAASAALPGADDPSLGWARLTPAHWQLGTEQVSMLDPALLRLDERGSRAVLEAVRELFESEGYALHWHTPDTWLIAHPSLAGLACASLDRVVGRNVDLWLPADPRARRLRRLQNEVQMLLYTHPLNAEREAHGELPVNSFWLDACGAWPAGARLPQTVGSRLPTGAPVLDDRLRAPALAEDAAAWAQAWQALDADILAPALQRLRQGQAQRLVLCGERQAVALHAQPPGWWRGLRARWRPADVVALLDRL